MKGTFDIYLQFCKELAICCVCKLFIYAESPKLHPLCIYHIVFTGKSCNKAFRDGSIYDSCLVYFVPNANACFRLQHPWGRTPGQPGEYVGENKGMDWFLPFPFKFKGKGKGGILQGGGGHSREVYVELCRRGLQALTLFKTKIAHFATLFKTGDTTF